MEDVRRYTDTTSIIKVDKYKTDSDNGVLDLRTPLVLNPHGRSLDERLPSGTNDNTEPVS